mgnify:FL=1|jgi:NitT/TauT family transport system substrate-binding protein
MKKAKILSTVLAVAMLLPTVACKNGSSPSPSISGSQSSGTTSLTHVTLGTVAWPTNELFYLAQEKGIFKKNGLDVTIQEFSSTTDSCNAFVSGKLDFCTYASSETIAPYSNGGGLNVVLVTDKSNGCEGLIAKPSIKTIKDLKGKTIATQLYSVDHMFLLTLLDQAGMTAKDVHITDMTIENSGNAFVAGKCDAACIWDPYFSKAKAAGGTVLYSSANNPDLITDVLVASNNMVSTKGNAVKSIMKSYFEATAYWKAHPDEANQFMGKKIDASAADFAAEMKGLYIPTEQDVVTEFTKADSYKYWAYTQNKVEKFMSDLGVIKSTTDCSGMIKDSFIKELAKG